MTEPTLCAAPRTSEIRLTEPMWAPWRVLVPTVALLLALGGAPALAQDAGPTPVTPLEDLDDRLGRVPGVFSVGLHGGLPGYRYASAVVAIEVDAFGLAGRVGYGTSGVSGGAQLRWYPPLGLPLPAYVATGLDLYADGSAWHLTLGAHVPVGVSRLRLDVEGGAARHATPQGPAWGAHASVGVSYAFPVTLDASLPVLVAAPRFVRGTSAGPECTADPEPAALDAAVDEAVSAFVDAESSETVEASGVAEMRPRQVGCRWVATPNSF